MAFPFDVREKRTRRCREREHCGPAAELAAISETHLRALDNLS